MRKLKYLNQFKHLVENSEPATDMYCAVCFNKIPDKHFERRAHHDCEHCPKCGNDFYGGKWFSDPFPKEIIDKIKAALSS